MIPSTLRFSPKVESSSDVTVITCMGQAGGAENTLAGHLNRGFNRFSGRQLLLDFSRVDSVCGNELGLLITLHRQMVASGGRLILFNLRAHVYEVFAITNLHTVLWICREQSLSSALLG